MAKFGAVPPEPKVVKSLDVLAPKFAAQVRAVLATSADRIVSESYRAPERSDWLYGMGRDYDDGRGIVTKAPALKSWHNFGLAVDIIHRVHAWNATPAFWEALAADAEAEGLVAGHRWQFKDSPHLQWKAMKQAPSDRARELLASGGVDAVWKEVGAL